MASASLTSPIPLERRPRDAAAYAEWFWAQVDRTPGPDACHPWRGPRQHWKGYGLVERWEPYWKGRLRKWRTVSHNASRVAYELSHGVRLARRVFVLHTCDNPECCNPKHLFLGSHAENMADMKAKGRGRGPHLYGMAHPNARFTPEQIAEVRRRKAAGATSAQIAEDIGMSVHYVREIARGKRRSVA